MTEITISPTGPGDDEAWDEYVRRTPGGHVYHTTGWRAVTVEALGHRSCCLKATDGAGHMVGVLPLFHVRTLLGNRLVSVPMRDRGGVLADSPAASDALLAAARALRQEVGAKKLELRAVAPLHDTPERERLQEVRYWVRSTIDLTPGVDELWMAMSKRDGRDAVKRARKRGLTAEIDDTPEVVDLFYRLFVHARRFFGVPAYGIDFFAAMYRHLVAKGLAHVLVVRRDGEPIHAIWCLAAGDHLYAAYGGTIPDTRRDKPHQFAYWEMMTWAIERGFTQFELGADSPKQEGLIAFKRRIGATAEPTFQYFDGLPSGSIDSSDDSMEWVRAVWRRLPLAVSNPLGRFITRQMD